MSDPQPDPSSPISQLLHTLGLTREDLNRHSDQMRHFLTAEHANSLRALSFTQDKHDLPKPSSSHRSFTSSSISRSSSTRDASPESALARVKSEPVEHALPTRQLNTMEQVLERQSRQNRKDRQSRKLRERRHTVSHNRQGSPSPSHASSSSHPSLSLDNFMQSRGVRRASVPDPSDPQPSVTQDISAQTLVTPSHRKYYRDYNTMEPPVLRSQKAAYMRRNEEISPSHDRQRSSTVLAVDSDIPTTPRGRATSPLPPSSPPGVPSSPASSPAKIYNTVSSPGPMAPLPLEDDYDDLPFTLPPGPYSTTKPELSYAALIGQAILSSHQHRLTLQEIYDWITIVYPYFQRGESTWMNSIRHVLSTTACFRKVVRDRSIGRTLWAIWDEDLPCFEGGGFKKHLCRDMESKPKGVAATRKRNAGTADDNSPKKSKRARKDKKAPPPLQQPTNVVPVTQPFPFFQPPHGAPMFPPIRPTAHHQPYYETCLSQTIPAEIIFPPLPPSAVYGYRHLMPPSAVAVAVPSTAAGTSATSDSASTLPEEPSAVQTSSSPRPSAMSWPSSMPGLTPNRSSSASPSLPSDGIAIAAVSTAVEVDTDDVFDDVFTDSGPPDALAPGITLLDHAQRVEGKKIAINKGKARQSKVPPKKSLRPPELASPSLNRKGSTKLNAQTREATALTDDHISRCVTPPSRPRTTSHTVSPARIVIPSSPQLHSNTVPTTPPRNTRSSNQHIELSPIRTPISHRGLHMSPSTSLAHYKSHLDPPPAAIFRLSPEPDAAAANQANADPNMRTPVRKRGAGFHPITPKRLHFPTGPGCGSQDSPLRTPSGRAGVGALAPSPFRSTPGSRGIFDAHDPGALLDDELTRLGSGQIGYTDSPAAGGLFGRLFESPNNSSPSRWTRWW